MKMSARAGLMGVYWIGVSDACQYVVPAKNEKRRPNQQQTSNRQTVETRIKVSNITAQALAPFSLEKTSGTHTSLLELIV